MARFTGFCSATAAHQPGCLHPSCSSSSRQHAPVVLPATPGTSNRGLPELPSHHQGVCVGKKPDIHQAPAPETTKAAPQAPSEQPDLLTQLRLAQHLHPRLTKPGLSPPFAFKKHIYIYINLSGSWHRLHAARADRGAAPRCEGWGREGSKGEASAAR